MPPPSLRYKGKLVWYPGIIFGRPPPEVDWNTGQGLGRGERSTDDLPGTAGGGLVWTTTEKLLADLEDTDHLIGVISVLELCLTVLTEPLDLLLAALRALTRLCWGYQDRVMYAVKCGVCEHISKVMHWYWSTDVTEVTLAVLHVIIMLADHGGREVRRALGSLGLPGYLTAALKWNRLSKNNAADVVEFCCKAIYQIALGCSANRVLLRLAGADKELYCLSRHPSFLPQLQQQQVKDSCLQVLALLKDQLLSDLADSDDCWFVFSSIQMSVADMRHYDPQHPDEGKGEDLVQTGLHAMLRLISDRPQITALGEINWSRTTQFALLGACELLVKVLCTFGHFKSSTTTACKAISTMLQDNGASGVVSTRPALRDGSGESTQVGTLQSADRNDTASVHRGEAAAPSKGHDEKYEYNTADIAPLNTETEDCQDIKKNLDVHCDGDDGDMEVGVLQAIVEEQRMMLSPEFLSQIEMADMNRKYSTSSFPSSNFELSPQHENIENNFQNGVRIVSNVSTDKSAQSVGTATILLEHREASDQSLMSKAVEVVQFDVWSRQERFRTAGVCEALVEILKINYQDSMLLSDEVLFKVESSRNSHIEQDSESTFLKSAVSSFSSFFSKSDRGAMFNAVNVDTASTNRESVPRSPVMQLASPRYRKSGNAAVGPKKSFQFRNLANELLESICDVIRRLVKDNIRPRLDFYRLGLYSVLYKIRQDDQLPDGDLDCVGSLQMWLNQQLVQDLGRGFSSTEETAMCITHALRLCVGSGKVLQCFVLLEDTTSDNLVTESTVLIRALGAIAQAVTRNDKVELLQLLFAARDEKGWCGCMSIVVNAVSEYKSDLEVVRQWCSTIATLSSSSNDLKSMLGKAGACTHAVALLDLHKTRPSVVQDILWCLCALCANNSYNLSEVLAWRAHRDPARISVYTLLQALFKSRSQTNETREHAELLLGWLDLALADPNEAEADNACNGDGSRLLIACDIPTSCCDAFERVSDIYNAVDVLYPVISRSAPRLINWTKGEPGTVCFDGEAHGYHGSTDEGVQWGAVEV